MLHRFLLVAATVATMSFTPALAETTAAQTPPPGAPSVAPEPLTINEVKAEMPGVRQVLDSELADYPGSRFRNVTAGLNSDGKFVVCGEVNAKNGMGGYAGWKPFWVAPWFAFPLLAGPTVTCTIRTPTPGDFTADILPRT